jgi:hypothetical protein
MKLKKTLGPILFFLMGSMFMTMILMISQCSKEEINLTDPVNPDGLLVNIDTESINKAAATIESALLSGDQATINSQVLDESLEIYQNNESPYTAKELPVIGNAFKSRVLTTATENFAEFTYTINGKSFILTMGCEKEGVWKIIRY